MDIAVCVIAVDPGNPDPQAYQQGDLVSVHPATQIGAFDGSEYIPHNDPTLVNRLGWVFILDVPINDITEFNLQNISEIDTTDPINPVKLKKKAYGASKTKVGTGNWNKFERERTLTVTWSQAKTFMERQGVNITDADLGREE